MDTSELLRWPVLSADRQNATTSGDVNLAQISKDFGISNATLHNWLKKADVEDGVRPGLTEADAQELRALKKRNRVLEQEVEILKRAAAYFARELSPK